MFLVSSLFCISTGILLVFFFRNDVIDSKDCPQYGILCNISQTAPWAVTRNENPHQIVTNTVACPGSCFHEMLYMRIGSCFHDMLLYENKICQTHGAVWASHIWLSATVNGCNDFVLLEISIGNNHSQSKVKKLTFNWHELQTWFILATSWRMQVLKVLTECSVFE